MSYSMIIWMMLCMLGLWLLGSAETALLQAGYHRVQRMLSGELETEDSLAGQDRLMTTILVVRFFLIFALGGLFYALMTQVDLEFYQKVLLALAFVFALVWVEIVARRKARDKSESWLESALPWLQKIEVLVSPIVNLLVFLAKPLMSDSDVAITATLEDVQDEILGLQAQGVLNPQETEIISSVFSLGQTIAREVMVPRVDMICIELGTSSEEALSRMREAGYSRLPVYEGSIDNILGFIHVKDILTIAYDKPEPISAKHLRETSFVPGTKKILEVLRELQSRNQALAVVLDEYGGTEGLLTVEDIIEEIVGEIHDEYDLRTLDVVVLGDSQFSIDASLILEDVNEELGVDLPIDDHETLGGFVYGLFGEVPEQDAVIDYEKIEFRVAEIEGHRIKRIVMTLPAVEEQPEEQSELAAVE